MVIQELRKINVVIHETEVPNTIKIIRMKDTFKPNLYPRRINEKN